MYYIGIDNGVSGGICILNENGFPAYLSKTPVHKTIEYTKKYQEITRVDFKKIDNLFKIHSPAIVYIERPMVNPRRFKATKSALRSLEATLIAIENNNLQYKFIDSKEWQRKYLPFPLKNSKLASIEICKRYGISTVSDGEADAYFIAKLCYEREKK